MAEFTLTPRELQRLRSSVHESRKAFEPFLKKRNQFIEQMVGANYKDFGNTRRSVPRNMTELLVSTLQYQLSSTNPRLNATTKFTALKPSSRNLSALVNHRLPRIGYTETHFNVVEDAILFMGIGYVGLEPGGVSVNDYDNGKPYATWISPDDFIIDMPAKRKSAITYIGHFYEEPLSKITNDPRYRITDQITAAVNDEMSGQDIETDRASDISRDTQKSRASFEQYKRHVRLADLYLPNEGLIGTFLASTDNTGESLIGDPIRVRDYYGVADPLGPYDLLSLHTPPDQVMPLSPTAAQFDMDLAMNVAYRKLFQSSQAQKDIFGYMAESSSDAEKIRDAPHLSMLRMVNPQGVQLMKFGGVDNGQLGWAIHLANTFKEHAGNLDLMGGLSPSSDTLGQDRLLGANASKRVQKYQDRVTEFTSCQFRKLAWYYFYDPSLNETVVKDIPGTKRTVTTTLTSADLAGEFLDYNYELDPYSMPHRSPSERLQALMGVYQGVIAPSLPFMSQQGIGVNWEAFFDLIAEYGSLHEVREILTFIGGSNTGQPKGDPPAKPAMTTRVNERVSRTENRGPDQAMLDRFLSGAGNGRQ